MSITDFLLARITEDEAAARAAIEDDGGSDEGFSKQYDKLIQPPSGIGHAQGGFGEAAARMIATYAVPARVLAECAAKRVIVESMDILTNGGKTYQQRMNHSTAEDAAYVIASDTLRTLAAIYADHDDYSPEWKVGA